MKKIITIASICTLSLSAFAANEIVDILGRANNTAHYTKNISVSKKDSDVNTIGSVNKILARTNESPERGRLNMGRLVTTNGDKAYYFNSEAQSITESDFRKMFDYNREFGSEFNVDNLNFNAFTNWKAYPQTVDLDESSLSYISPLNGYEKEPEDGDYWTSPTVSIVAANYACNEPERMYPVIWDKILRSKDNQFTGSCSENGYNNHAYSLANLIRKTSNVAVLSALNRYSTNDDNVTHFDPAPYALGDYVGVAVSRYTYNNGYERGYSSYNKHSLELDRYIYKHHVIEFAGSGNGGIGGDITDYGRAFNAITVGSANLESKAIDGNTSLKNPTFGNNLSYDKPEILNHGYFSESVIGTEASATYTAAMVANLLNYTPFYKWHPEAVKALLLTTSTIPVTGSRNTKKFPSILKGIVSYNSMKYNNRSRFWYGENGDMPSGDVIVFKEYNIEKGKKYRIAISWLVDPDYAKSMGVLPLGFSLKVSQPTKTMQSQRPNHTFQYLEFTAASDDPIEITIKRAVNKDTNHKIYLGYNMHEM